METVAKTNTDVQDLSFDGIDFCGEHDAVKLIRTVYPTPNEGDMIGVVVQTHPDHADAKGKIIQGAWTMAPEGAVAVPAELRVSNDAGCAVSWHPATMKDKKATDVPCLWADLDGHRYQPGIGLEPTVIVGSKNGDHLYWATEQMITDLKLATGLLRGLAIAHRGDPEVATPGHCLRLPGFRHQKDPQNPWDVLITTCEPTRRYTIAQIRAAYTIPDEKTWTQYEDWNWAHKQGLTVGEWGTPEWTRNAAALGVYRSVKPQWDKQWKGNQARIDMMTWEEGRSAKYWWGWLTGARLLAAWKKYGVAKDLGDQWAPAQLDPTKPEWLAEGEPVCRYWLAAVTQLESEGRVKDIKPFDPADVDPSDLRYLPEWSSIRRHTGLPLQHLDVVAWTKAVGIHSGERGNVVEITCPWADQHSGGTDIAGILVTPGKAPGYRCFHASCSGRSMTDVIEACGGVEEARKHLVDGALDAGSRVLRIGKPNLPVVHGEGTKWAGQPVRDRLENTEALTKWARISVKYNEMLRCQEVTVPGETWTPDRRNNAGIAYLRELSRRYATVNDKSVLLEHLELIGQSKSYHPVADWMTTVEWDGKDRFPELFASLTLDPDQDVDLARELIYRWMISAAGVVLENHGVGVQGCLVLQGAQGVGKTRWLASLVPQREWFGEGLLLDPSDRDSVEKAGSHWIVELGELDATFRRADVARLKAHITSPADKWRSAYDTREELHPRRHLYCGSVNTAAYLVDRTGNRRFWTIAVLQCNPAHGIDLAQLWAQMADAWRRKDRHWLDQMTQAKLDYANQLHEEVSPIGEQLARTWTPTQMGAVGEATTLEIREAIRPGSGWTVTETKALTAHMRDVWGLRPRRSHGQTYWRVTRAIDLAAAEIDSAIDSAAQKLDE